jgi:hypothetical protein
MNKKEIIRVGIQKANKSNQFWLEQTEFLVKGKANHTVQKPMSHIECELGQWLYSEGKLFNKMALYVEVESLNQEFHQIYEAIYKGAEAVYDSESHNAIRRSCAKLESHSKLIIESLEKVQESIVGDLKSKLNMDKNITNPVKVDKKSINEVAPVKSSGGAVDLRRQLKEQDLFQLKQEQQLTELELKQLEDRQKLTEQSAEQIAQYQSLKEEEINQQLSEHKVLEERNINNIYLGHQELSSIKDDILSKHDELEQLALVDEKLGQRKADEERKERKILNEFERKQSADKKDLVQIGRQREKWESEVEKLKQQLLLIEQDLESLVEKQSQKQKLIDKSNTEKEVKLEELARQSRLQDKLNGHKIRVKETKQDELKELEDEQSRQQRRLKNLEAESVALENEKVNISKQHRKELKELDESQRFKKMTIEKLEKDQGRKKQELKELVHQQSLIQQSLGKVESLKNESKKVLEEV